MTNGKARAVGVVLAVSAFMGRLDESMAKESEGCGPTSAYVLCTLMGRRIDDFDEVRRALPSDDPRGISLLSLQTGLQRLGVASRGVRLVEWKTAIRKPMILYLDRPPSGHFLVVRPVGHTGKLLQVIDPPNDPYVLDVDELVRGSEWTGLALEPTASSIIPAFFRYVAVGLALLASVATALKIARGRRGKL